MEQPPKKRSKTAGMANTAADSPPVSVVSYRWNDKNVFHAINEGRFPADKIFNRPHFFALLDKMPVTRGHALLIIKHPVATLFESKVPAEAMADVMPDLQVIMQQLLSRTGIRMQQLPLVLSTKLVNEQANLVVVVSVKLAVEAVLPAGKLLQQQQQSKLGTQPPDGYQRLQCLLHAIVRQLSMQYACSTPRATTEQCLASAAATAVVICTEETYAYQQQ